MATFVVKDDRGREFVEADELAAQERMELLRSRTADADAYIAEIDDADRWVGTWFWTRDSKGAARRCYVRGEALPAGLARPRRR